MRRQLFGLISVLLLASCASSVNQMMQSWVGHTADELMMKWGPPTQVVDGPAGGKFLVYRSSYDYTTPGVAPTAPVVVTNGYIDENGNFHATTQEIGGSPGRPPQTTTFSRTRTFYVNAQGVITSWSWQGL